MIFGFLSGPPAGTFAGDLAQHFQKSIAIRVSDIYAHFNTQPKAFATDMARICDLLAEGVLRPQVSVLPLNEAEEAHRRLESGQTTGKLVLAIK